MQRLWLYLRVLFQQPQLHRWSLMRLSAPLLLLIFVVAFVVALGGCQSSPTLTATPQPTSNVVPDGWELVWSDEFDGSALNPDNWVAESGAGGWGNDELQFYTDRLENLRVEGGVLVIETHQEEYRGSRYTSARIKTQDKHTFQYGRVEARMRLPVGRGIWPAFWMLGDDMPTVGWPRAGEIDIMENIGDPHTIHGTVHGPGYSGAGGVGRAYTARNKTLDQDFHTYAVEWAPGEIRWYLDDVLFNTITEADVPGAWVYDHPFFILLNLAVGGAWPGYPDATTQFPQQLLVDYVRIYRDPGLEIRPRQTLHASDVRLSLSQREGATFAEAWVTVLDEDGSPVTGAVVSAGWLGVIRGATEEATTNADGVAGPFTARVVSSAREVSMCISNIYKSGAIYDKNWNSATCAFQSR